MSDTSFRVDDDGNITWQGVATVIGPMSVDDRGGFLSYTGTLSDSFQTVTMGDWRDSYVPTVVFAESDLEREVLDRLRDDENFRLVMATVMANEDLIISIGKRDA